MKVDNRKKLLLLEEQTQELNLQDKRKLWMSYIDKEIAAANERFLNRKKMGKDKKSFIPNYAHILDGAPSWVFEDQELTLYAIDKGAINLGIISEKLSKDINYIKRYFKEVHRPYYFFVEDEFFKDKELFMMAFEKSAEVYRLCYKLKDRFQVDFFYEKSFILDLLKKDVRVYEYLRDFDKQDKDILLCAIENNVNLDLIKKPYAQKVLKDKSFALTMMERNPRIFPYLSTKLRSDKDFCLQVISKPTNYRDQSYPLRATAYNENLRYISKPLRNNKSFMSHYINHRTFYDLIGNDLKNDKDLMLSYLIENPVFYYNVKNVIEENVIYDVLLKELKKEHGYYIYKFLKDEWKASNEMIYEYLKHFDKQYVRDDASNFNLLPKKILEEINQELTQYKINNKLTWDFSGEPHFRDISLVDFARNKYLSLYLNEKSEKDNNKKKLMKI